MLKKINKKRNRKGFTLVELVVVIAILGILSAIAVPKLSKSRENASIVAHNANVRTLESAATLAVSESSGAIEWEKENGNEDTNEGKGWNRYLQDWPVFPKGLAGKEVMLEIVTGEGENQKTEVKKSKIEGTEVYKVKIDKDGGIIVTPGKIEDND